MESLSAKYLWGWTMCQVWVVKICPHLMGSTMWKGQQSELCIDAMVEAYSRGPWAWNGQFQLTNEFCKTGPILKSRKSKKSSLHSLHCVSQASKLTLTQCPSVPEEDHWWKTPRCAPSPLFCCYHHWGARAPEAHVWPRRWNALSLISWSQEGWVYQGKKTPTAGNSPNQRIEPSAPPRGM